MVLAPSSVHKIDQQVSCCVADSLVFLNKVKDKKIRKEKDELVSAISRHIQK